ncbi:MAG: MSMEG_1061 family FMN-dependent PPOX-type flavoprotein [Pseudomonadota bacterium]
MYQPVRKIDDEAALRQVMPERFPGQEAKVIDHIDPLIEAWIERSPFLTIASYNTVGQVDVSPKGDPAGFAKVLDTKTLAIPDRPGNHRYDTFRNILETGRVGLMFFVPNRREVVRVNGSAWIERDAALRARMTVNGKVPDFAVIVRVAEAFYHCGKAIVRSGLWSPGNAASIEGLPSYAEALKAHSKDERSLAALEDMVVLNEEKRLYDE